MNSSEWFFQLSMDYPATIIVTLYFLTRWLIIPQYKKWKTRRKWKDQPTTFPQFLAGVLEFHKRGHYDKDEMALKFIAWMSGQIEQASLSKRTPGAINMSKNLAWQPDAQSAQYVLHLYEVGAMLDRGEVPYDPSKDPKLLDGTADYTFPGVGPDQDEDCEGCKE